MEERKTAAIVLGILAFITILLTAVWPGINHMSHSLTFKNCSVEVHYIKGLEGDSYRAAQNQLAHCLCNSYVKHHDTAIAGYIIRIYQQYGGPIGPYQFKSGLYMNIDSLIKYKTTAFDTLVLFD